MNSVSDIPKLGKEAAEAFLPFVTPIYRRHPRRSSQPEQAGSAVYLGIGEHCFLMTAAHVLDMTQESELYCAIAGRRELIAIEGPSMKSGVLTGDGGVDIGIVDLTKAFSDEGIGPSMLELASLDVNESGAAGYYVALGYPATKNKKLDIERKSIRRVPLSFTGALLGHESVEALGHNPAFHMVLEFDKKKARTEENKVQSAPDPYGMSGGALLRLDPPDSKVVGILIEWERKGKLRGMVAVRIAVATEVIRKMCPNLDTLIPRPNNLRVGISLPHS